jgi:pimeloyl-ACP methyl ester carboxylesterase
MSSAARLRPAIRAAVIALMVGLAGVPAAGAAESRPAISMPVFVLRGALGIFSSGMDALADLMNANGVYAASKPFEGWRDYTAAIAKAYKAHKYPIALVGHSWGANTILLIAYELDKQNIPVALLVFYDITDSARVPPNVRWVINYRSTSAIGGNVQVVGGAGFTGAIDTITRPDLNHVQIDKDEALHWQTIGAIRRAFGETYRPQ